MVAWLLPIHIGRAVWPSARLSPSLSLSLFSSPLSSPRAGQGGALSGKLRLSTRDNKWHWTRGSRDDTTGTTASSSTRFLCLSLPPTLRLSLSLAPPPTFSSSSSSSSSFFFVRPGRERRQVGIRVAVNSPAPLSALMSLLLFALLNAIRAYSVSLPALPPSASPLSSTTPFVLFLLLLLLLVLFVFSRRGGFERHNTNVSLSRCVSVVVVDKRVSL